MSNSRRPKGTGSIREHDGRFEASYSFTDLTGQRRRKSKPFDTETAAERWIGARIAEVEAGRTADAGRVTVRGYLEDWLGSLGVTSLEPSTIDWYRSAVERHIIPALGATRLDRLTPTMIEAFLADRVARGRLDGKGGLSPASVKRLRVTLHKALKAAVRKGLLMRNPMELADSPKMPPRDVTVDVWTGDELVRFIEVTEDHRLGAVWRLAAMSGLRREELVGLQWGDVDLKAGRLSIRRAVVSDKGRARVKDPKTPASRRTVELDASTVATLRRWRRAQLEERLRAGTAYSDEGWVVADELGRLMRPDRVGRLFNRLVAATDSPRITIRQLRHSHATDLLAAGEQSKVVQERLGHSSIGVTLDVYSAVLPNMQREAIDRLGARFDAR